MSPLWVFSEMGIEPGILTLAPEEARHVTSRRLRIGDELVVFDGRGRTAFACVESLAKKAVQVVIEGVDLVPEPSSGFGLATAIPKGERLSTMLQMWTQLGLETWQPLVCDDSAVRKLDVEAPRLKRIVIEACKVARRPWAPRILPLRLLPAFVEGRDAQLPLYYGDRDGLRSGFDAKAGWVVIGPEAGFSESEIGLLRAAEATALSFGDYNLRIETAGVAALGAFNLTRANAAVGEV